MQKIGIILFILAIGACTKSEFCIEPESSALRMAFKTYDSTNTLIDTALVDADVYCTDTTVALVENIAALSTVDLYPNRKSNQQTYVIFNSNKRDTVLIKYSSEEIFVSNGCGYQYYFSIENVDFSKTNIATVNITDPLVTDKPLANNLEVIYK